MRAVSFNWQRMKNVQKIHQILYAIGLGPLIGRIILLLTTTGRKSGLKRVTPLQYEEVEGKYYLGAARGLKADWVRNIQSNRNVGIRVKDCQFAAIAEVVTDPLRIADFLEIRLQRHPFMIGTIMQKVHRLPRRPSREQLEKLAESEVMVVISPAGE